MPDFIVVKRDVADLKDHPRQQANFGDLPGFLFDELVADMDKNGQRHPVEATSADETIDGHQRVRAAKKLGWKQIDVIVRTDLDALGAAAIEMRMIEANLNRRQLDDLGVARAYKRLKELQPRRTRSASGGAMKTLRDRLAAQLGTKSGRTIDRYLRLLEAPKVVQDACTARTIGKSAALQVVSLPKAVQELIAIEIEAGGAPKAVIAKHTRKAAKKAEDPTKVYTRVLRQLEGAVGILDVNVARIAGTGLGSPHSIKVLEKSIAVLQRILSAEQGLKSRRKRAT